MELIEDAGREDVLRKRVKVDENRSNQVGDGEGRGGRRWIDGETEREKGVRIQD